MFNTYFALLEDSYGDCDLYLLPNKNKYLKETQNCGTHAHKIDLLDEKCHLVAIEEAICCVVLKNSIKIIGDLYGNPCCRMYLVAPSIHTGDTKFLNIKFKCNQYLDNDIHATILAIDDNFDIHRWHYDRYHNWSHCHIKNDKYANLLFANMLSINGYIYKFNYVERKFEKITNQFPSDIIQCVRGTIDTKILKDGYHRESEIRYYILLKDNTMYVCDKKFNVVKKFSEKIRKCIEDDSPDRNVYAITEDNRLINLHTLNAITDLPLGKVNDASFFHPYFMYVKIGDHLYYKHHTMDHYQQIMYSDDDGITVNPATFKNMKRWKQTKSAKLCN